MFSATSLPNMAKVFWAFEGNISSVELIEKDRSAESLLSHALVVVGGCCSSG